MKGIGKRAIIHTLNVYKERRAQLLEDTKSKASDLYLGLYSLKKSDRENYLDRYMVLWMMSHIKIFQMSMKNIEEPNGHQFVFEKSYLRFLEYEGYHFYSTQLAVDMLKEYQKVIEDMIKTSQSWDQGYDKLCAEQKRQAMKFSLLREKMEEENKATEEI